MRKASFILSAILVSLALAGCTRLVFTPAPTSMPIDFIPTVLALTQRAAVQAQVTPSPILAQAGTQPPTATLNPLPDTPTQGPSPTSIAYNPSATATTAVTVTTTPTLTNTPNLSPTSTSPSRSTSTSTVTPTPKIPIGDVQISRPGPMSRLTSPIRMIANSRSLPSGTYHVELLAEPLQPGGDARLLYREVQRIVPSPIDWIYIDKEIQFELSRVSEFSQLRLSVFDKFGRPAWVGSVDLVLLSMGPSEITPRGLLTQSIVIDEPAPNKLIQGGTLILSGVALPSEKFLVVELVTFDGIIVGYRQVYLPPSPDGSYVPYAVEVPYTVTTPTWVRLRIFENSARIPGIQRLSSVEVYLTP